MPRMTRILALLALAAWALPGCDTGLPAGRTPHREFNFLDMADQPKLKPQRADIFGSWPTGLLESPLGAVAVGERPYPFAQDQADSAAVAVKNPLLPSKEALAHGKFVFENVCFTCHGLEGAGDGPLTWVFPKPPSLMTQRVRDFTDGAIFHRPMRGQKSMPSHAQQLSQEDIWAVVHHLRSLQARLPVAPAPATPTLAAR